MSTIAILIMLSPLAVAADPPVDYVRKIKPLLAARCYACHAALKQQAELRLDTAAAVRKGGESGPAAVPGKSGDSPLIARLTESDPTLRMPPESEGTPLKPAEIALLKAWIDQGANGPLDEKPEADPREHWAFRAPVRPAEPQVSNAEWVRNPIDAFIADAHQRQGLVPQPSADKGLLLRRIYLDLIGLPPTAEELAAFVADETSDAYERIVERLLTSPQYGERWGRHWMDIWRYSDWWGLGAEVRNSQKHVWHWRDWIMESLNDDVGYDEMLRQMLAADELYPNDLSRLRATGLLVRHYFKFNRNTWMEETVEHTSKAFLGLTLNCARCHDHKYDPFAQTDYYRLRAFFEPYQVRTDQVPGEVDYEQDGIPRIFDCHLDVPTYRFVRGDEKQPAKDQPLTPGLPRLLMFDELQIEPIVLPPESQQPGLRPWVLENYLAAAKQRIKKARESLEIARQVLADAAKPIDAAALPAVSTAAKPNKVPTVEEAQAAFSVAEKELAAAEAHPPALEARAAADRARAEQPMADHAGELARQAARAERQAAAAKAAADLARAELDFLRADEAKKAEAEKKVVAARDAADKAAKAVDADGARYSPLTGALKALESNLETADSRAKPFPATSSGRRTALARWLTDRRNPLTARVAVNHVWARHMGKPLVPTVFDFGRKGTPPTHPELLDWLAIEFMEHEWSMKHLHRLIVTSNVYRLSSSTAGAVDNHARDPENRDYWHANPLRMEAQLVRDALLHLSGELDPALGGPSVDPVKDELSRRRSLYFVHSHNDHHRFLSMFDDAGVQECYRRDQSIVPQQALALSNSRQAFDAATKIAAQIQARPENSPDAAFIRAAFLTVLASEPNQEELDACQLALEGWMKVDSKASPDEAARRARTNLVHALLNHNDFVTIR